MSETILAGRYRLLELIGEGGMARVYRAIDQNTGHNVAIKVMKSELSQDADYISRFQREAEAASKMTHHNIVNLLDVGMEGSERFLVMEYVQGKTLKQLIQEKGRLNPTVAAQITIRILSALQHAHQNGIIHRDIKPQNIMVASEGHIKVGDFGIARIANSYTLTRDDSVMGTVYYYSPEQASGQKDIDATTDLYSVGVVLYEMLTGRVPFDGDSHVAIAMMHLYSQPTPIQELAPDVPPAIAQVCMTAMAKDRRFRYQSAREMAAELRDALDGRLAVSDAPKAVEKAPAAVPVGNPQPVVREKVRPSFHVSGRQLAWFGATALLTALVIFGLFIGGKSIIEKVTNSVTVPDLIGMDRTKAIAMSNRMGLNVETVYINHPNISSGLVIQQMPLEGETLNKNDTVTITVSKGPASQVVPKVTGMNLTDAIESLKAAGLTLMVVERVPSPDVQVNYVMTQVPEANQRCNPGDVVQVTVSGGLVIVPGVEGRLLYEATELLVTTGLRVSDALLYADTTDRALHGHVASQSPAEGSSVIQDTQVTLTVYQVPGLSYSAQVTLNLEESSEVLDVRVTLVNGALESNVYQNSYPPDAPTRNPEVTIKAQLPGEYTYKVYINGRFAYQSQIRLE